jgi:hypothetical protein
LLQDQYGSTSWFNKRPVANVDYRYVINTLRDINKIVEERIGKEYQIGQSFFMKERLALALLKKN